MRLKILEMNGFKSFVDRTTVQFEDGITGIVGPNGCGKSNIVDAIKWVMGEMSVKQLRGQEMQDVIFNGCESRASVGMAQVFLTFDNSDGRAPADYADYSEIQLGRRLYRSGESEYFINKTPCRLKDIVDLFLGTGVGTKAYSIVEQGMVGAIVSARPQDRRLLIEEAAGISKFKSRKEAALRKMEATKLNLSRLNDILNELARQMTSLSRQAKKAERYQRVTSELKEKELSVAATRHHAIRLEVEELESEHLRLKELEVTSNAKLSLFENEMEAKRIALAQLERELDGAQEAIYRAEHSVKLNESEISHRTKEDIRLSEEIALTHDELKALNTKLSEADAKIVSANEAMIEADMKLAELSETTQSLELEVEVLSQDYRHIEEKCASIKNDVMSLRGAIANLNATIDLLKHRHSDVTGKIEKNQAETASICDLKVKHNQTLSLHEREVEGSQQVRLNLASETQAKANSVEVKRNALKLAEDNLALLREDILNKRAHLASLKQLRKNLDGYNQGVRAILTRLNKNGEKPDGVIGTVADEIEIAPEFETALGAVLGERLQYVIIKSHDEGVDAIDYLKSSSCGRSTFIPLGVRTKGVSQTEATGEGVIGPILNFVRFSDDYRSICHHLLSDVVLVDDLKCALNLWTTGLYQKSFVTRDGCVVDSSGIVSGGSNAGVEGEIIAQRRRAKELEDEISHLNEKLKAAEGEVQGLQSEAKAGETELEALKLDTHGKDLDLVGQERDLNHLRDEIVRLETQLDRLTQETQALTTEMGNIEGQRNESEAKINQQEMELADMEAQLTKLEAERSSMSDALERQTQALTDLKIEFAKFEERASSAERELAGLVRTRTEALVRQDKYVGDISSTNTRKAILARETEFLRSVLDHTIRSVSLLQDRQRSLKDNFDKSSVELREQELAIRDLRKGHQEALAQFHNVDLKLSDLRGKMLYLSEGMRERYHIDLGMVEAQYSKDDIDIEAEEECVADLKERIENMGPVNVEAIHEFEDLSARHEFLKNQNADLMTSLDNLSKAIARINRVSRQRFRHTFEKVDNQFRVLFPKLFCGGQARLMLTDEEDVLETGIEIIAQPPGKKLQSITLLSGGEKALTAVALVFSIFLIKPTPFCLLDEVDAPLDDANIDRFNDLIRSMTPHSQFILITHNKRTMELADLLYGITMEEAGVSKMVSVKLGVERELKAA